MNTTWNGIAARIVDEREVDPRWDEAVRQNLCVCFPQDAAAFSQVRGWHGYRPQFSAYIEAEGTVVAHVGVVDHVVRVGARPVRVGGVQNVYVLPAYRGMGLCDRVMNAAMAEADRRGMELGLLFCSPALAKMYGRTGWISVEGRRVICVRDGTENAVAGHTMYHPLALAALPAGDIHLQGNDW
jgi:predicted N-acetyltransferase YhbS